jgi:hypothetical protein
MRSMERAIADSTPDLADRFTLFSALHRWDDMPCTEHLKAREVSRLTRVERWIAPWLST